MVTEGFYKQIGSSLRVAREERKMTQGELASAVGLSRTSLTNIELGRQRILVDQLVDLAEALHISVARLIPERPTGISHYESTQLESMPAVTDFLNNLRSHNRTT
ncbi:helix-turn-helix domain-containing protein [Massilia timonae]|uniref:helix-turn-helix domain-containing protein n=1 Tax=Massilia timonae TaxID=47229 RepID=UPI0009F2423A